MRWPFTSYLGARSPKKVGLAYIPLASGDYEPRTSFQDVPEGTF
ncbi:MAG TPA: hypothetical protein VFY56_08570 [Propionibacteriaceae bacterium]|nr:hypothetical protein [Propionibacteriaceae bacterium]